LSIENPGKKAAEAMTRTSAGWVRFAVALAKAAADVTKW
jgi:hypothetical protein